MLDPQKVIFGHFIYFGHFPIEIPIEAENFLSPWEGVELQRKQNMFWDQWSNENSLGTCTIWYQKLFSIRITLLGKYLNIYKVIWIPCRWTKNDHFLKGPCSSHNVWISWIPVLMTKSVTNFLKGPMFVTLSHSPYLYRNHHVQGFICLNLLYHDDLFQRPRMKDHLHSVDKTWPKETFSFKIIICSGGYTFIL